MTNRERQFANLGFEYAEGIDSAKVVIVPVTGREIRRTDSGKWECQPPNDNYWQQFDDLLDAAKFAVGAKDGCRLGDIALTQVWFAGVGAPAGQDWKTDEDWDNIELPEGWENLTGMYFNRKWNWDGTGKPTDFNGNTVYLITAWGSL